MCAAAEIWAGIPEVIYATSVESLIGYGLTQFRLDSPTMAAAAPFYSGEIIGGVLAERADAFYKVWAKRRRG
jgi:tRNA(Arg) A34 adenosine deaminase TadA